MFEQRLLRVHVKPSSRTTSLSEQTDGTWKACVRASPVDGKANAALIELIAEHFDCRKSDVVIKSGATSKLKTVLIQPR